MVKRFLADLFYCLPIYSKILLGGIHTQPFTGKHSWLELLCLDDMKFNPSFLKRLLHWGERVPGMLKSLNYY